MKEFSETEIDRLSAQFNRTLREEFIEEQIFKKGKDNNFITQVCLHLSDINKK